MREVAIHGPLLDVAGRLAFAGLPERFFSAGGVLNVELTAGEGFLWVHPHVHGLVARQAKAVLSIPASPRR